MYLQASCRPSLSTAGEIIWGYHRIMTLPLVLEQTIEQHAARLGPASSLSVFAEELRGWFNVEFSLWDGTTGELLHAAEGQPRGDESLLSELVRTVAKRPAPQFLGDEDCVVLLALPLESDDRRGYVAVAPFVTRHVDGDEDLSGPARLLQLDEPSAARWISEQTPWPTVALERLGSAVLQRLATNCKVKQLEHEIDEVSLHLSSTYEEISLLYALTQNLRLSSSDEELGTLALNWLIQCLPAKGIAIQYLPVEDDGDATYQTRTEPTLLTSGTCPLDGEQFTQLIAALNLTAESRPLVANHNVTLSETWSFPEVQQLIVVPLTEGEHIFGWLAAVNHAAGEEFGTVEASLLSSVAAILGIHSGNRELVRQQAEFLASVVRALTSAIDAKDPYTCGHSDRVARVAVRLAEELFAGEADAEEVLDTLYMAGLLHDIGKIGIDDQVLRKPGKLTESEFEHIKLHPELGHRILADLKQLAPVLPVVLHHHEQWDGGGYPHKLAGEQIPLLARIVAVADSYDAMTSDRPYRKGMPLAKVEDIFRNGQGKQWDARVIDAYFAARDDIQDISRRERANLTLDVQQWT
jgi:HD-GYP domain-containing protein (c-di-GMP phosphodiesterase class II)